MDLEGTNVLQSKVVGRAAEMAAELRDCIATVELPHHSLNISATVCSGTLFQRQMLALAASRHEDVLLVRHDMHSETLDPLTIGLALPAPGKATLVTGLLLFRRKDEL